ncbi:epithelial chloride channel protein-like [Acanthaster planci]|uniref:Epithelial chloride channel protein-like n=1 Tax=Acanthaster planci TaxID=133434 RepID=A0A8B8A2H7_ACAPL|nr:epithelial chloride channel protein-like [Acanthaster planci]
MTLCRQCSCVGSSLSLAVFMTLFGRVCLMSMPPPPVGSWNRAPVSLVDNGYRGIVLAIAEGVPEDFDLVEEIKVMFTEASAFLYEASDHRVYFHDITILLPQSWADDPSYLPAMFESFYTANILVNTAANRYIPAQPFVKQPGMCGEEGSYLHLTKELIRQGNQGPWGNLSRVLVHEWGHLRWGLFDEYPSRSNDHHFYLTNTGSVEPTRCSKAVTGDVLPYLQQRPTFGEPAADIQCEIWDNVGHLPDHRCRFQPHGVQAQGASGSLMYAHYVDQITGFCHSNVSGDVRSLHNPEAPNRHNTLCNSRSAWDVMLATEDFANGANPTRTVASTLPQFTVKRVKKMRVVLVLDASKSMNDNRKFQKLLRASAYYLTDVLPMDTWVALVAFNASASILAPLTKIRYKSSRQKLVDKLPNVADGNSSIGAGILKALTALSTNGESPAGGVVLVMSDGLEDTAPFFSEVFEGVRNQGVDVDALAYSTNVDENFHLPSEGGGGSFFIPFAENDTIATEKPTTMQMEDEEFQDWERFITIVRRSEMLRGNGNGTNNVHIDNTVGYETIFRFIWEIGQATAVVRTPEGFILDPGRPEYSVDTDGRQIEIRITGIAQTGTWFYDIQNMNMQPQTMRAHVYSKPSDPVVPPLRAKGIIRKTQVNFTAEQRVIIYCEVTQGELPVIRAEVKALVERPGDGAFSESIVVELFDLGTGADTEKDDGIYSAYFISFTGDGIYKVTFEVENKAVGQAKKITFPQTLGGVMPQNWNNTKEPVLVDVDAFMRATQPVEFTVVSAPDPDKMNEVDMFPPARVNDLRVASFSRYEGRLTLQWTAPGDDFDIGTAAEYDLRYSHSFNELFSDFSNAKEIDVSDIISGDLSAPQESGSEEMLVLKIPTMLSVDPKDLMLFLAFRIRAIDDSELAGETSNIATVVVDYGASPTTTLMMSTLATQLISSTPTISTLSTSASSITTCASSTKTNNYWTVLGKNMAIVLGVAVILMAISIIVLIVACTTKRRNQRNYVDGQVVSHTKARPTTDRVSDAWVLEEI